jgi:hypothetical protein
MTVTLKLPEEFEARLIAEAGAKGVAAGELATEYLYRTVPAPDRRQVTAEEIEKAFEEIADLRPAGIPPLSDAATSRESIYTREDDWDRLSGRI